jgi:hypothetical protein
MKLCIKIQNSQYRIRFKFLTLADLPSSFFFKLHAKYIKNIWYIILI